MPDQQPREPLVPRPVISFVAIVLIVTLPFQITLDALNDGYDGTIGTLVLGGLLAGICGFELIVGIVRKNRGDE